MKCPKCGYTSFDHLEACKKCNDDLTGHQARFNLRTLLFPVQPPPAADFDLMDERPEETPPLAPPLPDETTKGDEPAAETEDLIGGDLSWGDASDAAAETEPDAPLTVPEDLFDFEQPPPQDTLPAPTASSEEAPATPDDFDLLYKTPQETPPAVEGLPPEENLAELFLGSLGESAFEETAPAVSAPHPLRDDDLATLPEATADADLCDDAEEPAEAPLTARLAATLADMGILGLAFGIFVVAGEMALAPRPDAGFLPTAETLLDLSTPYFLVLFALCFGYFTLFHFLTGQTPGKMLFRLRVEGEDGTDPLFSQAFLRSAGGLLCLLPLGLGYLRIVFDGQRRGWNDRLAGSRVVRIPETDGEGGSLEEAG